MQRVRANSVYVYRPVGCDLWDARTDLQPGEKVRVVNLPGCPKANTMGMCHVKRLGSGPRPYDGFAGLVLCNSLNKE